MYFQKLEALSRIQEYTSLYITIEALDNWLATLPKSYRNNITPELFSRAEEVDYETSYKLFDKLSEEKLLGEVFALRCKHCRSVLYYNEDLNKVLEYMIEYNRDEYVCEFCEKLETVTTDNIFVLYKLIEKPVGSAELKKKYKHIINESEYFNKNLSDRIIEKPEKYVGLIDADLMKQVSTPQVQDALKFILES